MALEEVARVFFDHGIELFIGSGERIERIRREVEIADGLGVREDIEENLWWEGIETVHVMGQDSRATAVKVAMRSALGSGGFKWR